MTYSPYEIYRSMRKYSGPLEGGYDTPGASELSGKLPGPSVRVGGVDFGSSNPGTTRPGPSPSPEPSPAPSPEPSPGNEVDYRFGPDVIIGDPNSGADVDVRGGWARIEGDNQAFVDRTNDNVDRTNDRLASLRERILGAGGSDEGGGGTKGGTKRNRRGSSGNKTDGTGKRQATMKSVKDTRQASSEDKKKEKNSSRLDFLFEKNSEPTERERVLGMSLANPEERSQAPTQEEIQAAEELRSSPTVNEMESQMSLLPEYRGDTPAVEDNRWDTLQEVGEVARGVGRDIADEDRWYDRGRNIYQGVSNMAEGVGNAAQAVDDRTAEAIQYARENPGQAAALMAVPGLGVGLMGARALKDPVYGAAGDVRDWTGQAVDDAGAWTGRAVDNVGNAITGFFDRTGQAIGRGGQAVARGARNVGEATARPFVEVGESAGAFGRGISGN